MWPDPPRGKKHIPRRGLHGTWRDWATKRARGLMGHMASLVNEIRSFLDEKPRPGIRHAKSLKQNSIATEGSVTVRFEIGDPWIAHDAGRH